MERLGRYRLGALLGEGGFGVVYRAWDPLLNRAVAVKALKPHLASNSDFRRRFFAEASAIARLRHPNVVTIFDVSEDEDRPFFAMELIEGGTLADMLLGGEGLPLDQTCGIITGLASALSYVHRCGMVHRDLKAANVMVEESGRVVLMDFGIARALDRTPYTRTGAIMGTPEVVSPEQVLGNPVTALGDVYALGVLVYHMLAGRPPFTGEIAHLLYAHAFKSAPPLRELRPGLPEAVYSAVDSALVKDPALRCQSAEEFAGRFSTATPPATGWPASPTRTEPPARVSSPVASGARTADLAGFGQVAPPPAHPASETFTDEPAAAHATLLSPGSARRGGRRVVLAAVMGAGVLAFGLAVLMLRPGGDGATPLRDVPVAAAATPVSTTLPQSPGPGTPTATPTPVLLSDLKVYDDVVSQRQDEFLPSSSIAACFSAGPEAAGQPVSLLVTGQESGSSAEDASGVVGRLDVAGITAGPNCHAIALPGEPLPPAEYRVLLQQRGNTVLETGFRALPARVPAPPAPVEAAPAPAEAAPAPVPNAPPVRAATPAPAPAVIQPPPAPVSTARATPVQPQPTLPPVSVQPVPARTVPAATVPPAAPATQPAVVTVAPAAAPPPQPPAVVTRVAGPPPLEAPATTSPSR